MWPCGDTEVLKNNSWVSAEKIFLSPSGHVMFHFSYKHHYNTKPFHFNSVLL